MKPQGIIFDFDGCIVDSESIYLDSLQHFLDTHMIQVDQEDLLDLLGRPAPSIIELLQQRYEVLKKYSPETLHQLTKKNYQSFLQQTKIEPMDGLRELLNLCHDEKMKLAIATSSSYPYIIDMLDRIELENQFDIIVTREEIVKGKPDPEIFLLAQKRLELPKESLVIIEDSYNGIQAGKASGMFTIGYKGAKVIQDTSKADLEIDSYHSSCLLDMLK